MVTTQLNPAQLNVLGLMAYIDTEQEQQELQDILLQFYRKKTDRPAATVPEGARHNPGYTRRMGKPARENSLR